MAHKQVSRTIQKITTLEYGSFQKAYDYFNDKLFQGSLPQVMITFQRHAKTRGYFSPERFSGRGSKETTHELAMNPDNFVGRSDMEILSTLAHEQAHVWQNESKDAPRRGYHDRGWGAKMKEIGLYPSSTGQPGGKETGQHMTHYIMENGLYQKTFRSLEASGFKLNLESFASVKDSKARAKANKTKFTCPACDQNAWAKPGALLICGECQQPMEAQ